MVIDEETRNAMLQDLIPKLDVDAIGIVSLAEWEGTRLTETALKLLPQARSVVVLGMEIYREILELASPEEVTGAASLTDLLDGAHDFLKGRHEGILRCS